jgi:hypothetical protein
MQITEKSLDKNQHISEFKLKKNRDHLHTPLHPSYLFHFDDKKIKKMFFHTRFTTH